ncbi:phosphoenolpyruvate synthase [Priestia flexa]|uniref:phosphoenolpyruvate synthase n=1 Tax=Priestia flexa TaxID=86664 RepID=UPI003D2F2217
MNQLVLSFGEIDRSSLAFVGGKGANLGELSKAGFPVPGGFCITTHAYKQFIATSPEMDTMFDELNQLDTNDLEHLRAVGERIRTHLEQIEMPVELKKEIIHAWKAVGEQHAYAIRSSATAEDLPTASFAGQQDTYLNIKGEENVIEHIQRCWASLFTDRAISYRAKNNFNHREVHLSVVVQRMVHPELSGIMFTADPITGNRNVISIDGSFGLGEALVSGLVSADLYKVKNEQIIERNISEKKLAIYSLPEGGTVKKDLSRTQQIKQALTDEQILKLAKLGKKIERHYDAPQDIEFCIENKKIYIVQSRPITSLFPLPHKPKDFRVLISLGHVQVMTDAMKPLGISAFQTILSKDILKSAGGRLFFDATDFLHSKIGKKIVIQALNNMEESMSRAVSEFVKREDFLKSSKEKKSIVPILKTFVPIAKQVVQNLTKNDPSMAKSPVEKLIKNYSLKAKQELTSLTGTQRLEAVQYYLENIGKEMLKIFSNPATFMVSSQLLKKRLTRVMGSDKEIHNLTKSLPGNVMSEMGLQLGDLADIVRKYPEVEKYLENAKDETFYSGLVHLTGGQEFTSAFQQFIEKYGMRCPGEIDITRPRWRERPTLIVTNILGDVRNLKEDEYRQNFLSGLKEVEESKERIFAQTGHHGKQYKKMKRLIDVYRYMGGLREHHKHFLTIILDLCKQAIMAEAEEMRKKHIIQHIEDVYYFSLEELIQISKGTFNQDISGVVEERKDQFKWHQTLKQPRVMTSEGEIITGSRKKGNYPPGALVGSPVSAGVVEGIARVILSPEKAQLREGEILVAPHTDPGWTPLFQSAQALVTEVGGLMTHGSVVAREYGIPAVVGLDDATTIIKDGQRIRVNGDDGYVEILNNEGE